MKTIIIIIIIIIIIKRIMIIIIIIIIIIMHSIRLSLQICQYSYSDSNTFWCINCFSVCILSFINGNVNTVQKN